MRPPPIVCLCVSILSTNLQDMDAVLLGGESPPPPSRGHLLLLTTVNNCAVASTMSQTTVCHSALICLPLDDVPFWYFQNSVTLPTCSRALVI